MPEFKNKNKFNNKFNNTMKPLSFSKAFDDKANKSDYLVISDKEILDMIKEFGFNETINNIAGKLEKFPYKK